MEHTYNIQKSLQPLTWLKIVILTKQSTLSVCYRVVQKFRFCFLLLNFILCTTPPQVTVIGNNILFPRVKLNWSCFWSILMMWQMPQKSTWKSVILLMRRVWRWQAATQWAMRDCKKSLSNRLWSMQYSFHAKNESGVLGEKKIIQSVNTLLSCTKYSRAKYYPKLHFWHFQFGFIDLFIRMEFRWICIVSKRTQIGMGIEQDQFYVQVVQVLVFN